RQADHRSALILAPLVIAPACDAGDLAVDEQAIAIELEARARTGEGGSRVLLDDVGGDFDGMLRPRGLRVGTQELERGEHRVVVAFPLRGESRTETLAVVVLGTERRTAREPQLVCGRIAGDASLTLLEARCLHAVGTRLELRVHDVCQDAKLAGGGVPAIRVQ